MYNSSSPPKCVAAAGTNIQPPLPLCFWHPSESHQRLPQSSQQEKTFPLRLMGTNSALCPQGGQNNVLMLQFLTFRSLPYLVNFILLLYLDWLTVTLKVLSWRPHLLWVTFSKFKGISWTSCLYHYYYNKFQKHKVQQGNKREKKANNFLLKLTASKKYFYKSYKKQWKGSHQILIKYLWGKSIRNTFAISPVSNFCCTYSN